MFVVACTPASTCRTWREGNNAEKLRSSQPKRTEANGSDRPLSAGEPAAREGERAAIVATHGVWIPPCAYSIQSTYSAAPHRTIAQSRVCRYVRERAGLDWAEPGWECDTHKQIVPRIRQAMFPTLLYCPSPRSTLNHSQHTSLPLSPHECFAPPAAAKHSVISETGV